MPNTLRPSLKRDITTNYLIIGGGVAGLHAAQTLIETGKEVVLLEKTTCGGNASGRSSGFVTPDSELELNQLIRRFGVEGARTVWSMAERGVSLIKSNIRNYHLPCDFQPQDSCFLGIGEKGKKAVAEEAQAREQLGYPFTSYTATTLKKVHPTKAYSAALRYPASYGINSFRYVQGLKEKLIKQGLQLFENSEVTKLEGTTAKTKSGVVRAKQIIICIDKMKSSLSDAADNTYHAQTFLAISEPLTHEEVQNVFPEKPLMCWDSQLVYTYYRLLGDRRLLLGGGTMLTTYYPTYFNFPLIAESVIREFKQRFPALKSLQFTHYWPGFIDITRDLMPIVDQDKDNPAIHYVQGCPGLPWAAFSGEHAALLTQGKPTPHYKKYLSAQRPFFISNDLQDYLGKVPSFAINNLYAKYKQHGY